MEERPRFSKAGSINTDSGDNLTTYRRRQIIEAAFKVISHKGVGATRLVDIASEAEISLGSVQYYFRHRSTLIADTFETLLKLMLATWQHVSIAEADPLRRLFALLRLQVFGCVQFRTRWAFWIEFWSAAKQDPMLKHYAKEVYTRWNRPFEEAIKKEVSDNDFRLLISREDLVTTLMALIDGLAVRVVMDPESVDEETMFKLLVDAACLNLSISQDKRAAALKELPHVISMSYPHETQFVNRIDWRALDIL